MTWRSQESVIGPGADDKGPLAAAGMPEQQSPRVMPLERQAHARIVILVGAVLALSAFLIAQDRSPTSARGTSSAIATPQAAGAAQRASPRLLVLLVVDQFRADYVTLYGAQWSQGLKRLLNDGASFPLAAIPYGVTKTCAGHSSIATGTVPAVNGMIDNEWYDSTTKEYVACTADSSATSIPFAGGRGLEHHSAKWMRGTTLADELRRQSATPPTIVALGLKARSAISLAGHGGANTFVAWEEDSGTWATSSAFARTPPPPIEAFIATHAPGAARGQMWNRLLAPTAYLYEDRAAGEVLPSVFPHVLQPPSGAASSALWDASPFSDAYLGELAIAVTKSLSLGGANRTDLLAVSFAALDYVGHNWGPRSHEVQDTLARLDVTIGRLLTALDAQVGQDQYVVALTSDHGVAPLPESGSSPTAGGRLSMSAVARAAEAALVAELGRRPYIEALSGPYIYLRPEVANSVRASASGRRLVDGFTRTVPGVERLYWASDLAATTTTTDAVLTAMRRSYFAGRSGDLVVVPKPYWVLADAGTNHGSPYEYDTRVPLVLFGAGVKPGRYSTAATPLDIAPTLASLAHVALPRTDGRLLLEAVASIGRQQ